MTSRTLDLCDVLQPDRMATQIARDWLDKDMMRQLKKNDWQEIIRYVYATDTTQTSNSKLPWKNKTTIPKLCQISDNLYSNYTATLFPKQKWVEYEADESDSNSASKRDAIVNYMLWVISQPSFKHELDKVIYDYIHRGNCFVTAVWEDNRVEQPGKIQVGYVGPVARRINPLNLVMNPTSENFLNTPKIVRSIINLGELKLILDGMADDENKEEYQNLWNYLKEIRSTASSFEGDLTMLDGLYQMDGFTSFRSYLQSDYAEVLTFYGDLYDKDNDVLLRNHVITVVDRHKLIGKKPNPSFFGYPPIFHAPWRKKPDNLWGMGPLDNLIGMQYRMDHIENMKADIFDLVTFPVQKIKGSVEDFKWQPGEKIFIGDEGDVEMLVPDVNALSANMEIQNLERLMEEMAGAPKEAMGFRTPGEKTKYEVQTLQNASYRVFNNKIKQFEEQIIEPLLNAMLELARRNMNTVVTIKVFNDENKVSTFETLTVDDITGVGRIKPVAARHFAEQAELIQNLTNLTASNLWSTVQPHFSSIKLAKIIEKYFNLDDFEVMRPFVALAEQADAQKAANALQEQVLAEIGTASGMGHDFDLHPQSAADPMNNPMVPAGPSGPPSPQGPQGAAPGPFSGPSPGNLPQTNPQVNAKPQELKQTLGL